jgi:hypothetical protein
MLAVGVYTLAAAFGWGLVGVMVAMVWGGR